MSPTDKPTKPIDIYVRVSQTAGRDVEQEGGTAAEQERLCRAKLETSQLKASQVFVDLDQSGGKTSRPAFDKMLARIEAGLSGGVVVRNLSRFGRNRKVADDIIRLEEASAAVLSVDDDLNTSKATGRFALQILAAVNNLYLEQVTEGWRNTHERMVERGVHNGPTPVGYRKPPKEGGLAQPLELDGDPEDPSTPAGVVRAGYKLKARGMTFGDVADLFNRNRLPVRSGLWTANNARKTLGNKLYLGWAYCGKAVNKNAHPPIIDEATWRRANEITIKSPVKGRRYDSDAGGLLAKLLTCSGCGKHLTQGVSVRKHKTAERRYRYYNCHHTKNCPNSIRAEAVERYVLDAVYDRISVIYREKTVADGVDTAELDAAVEAAQADYNYARELLDVEELPENSKQAVALQEALDARDRALDDGASLVTVVYDFDDPDLIHAIEALPIGHRRRMIAEQLGEIVVRGGRAPIHERVSITWKDGAVHEYEPPPPPMTAEEAQAALDEAFESPA
ncbi:MAG: recombinase family protein [Gaiellaceae bacterium]